MTTQTITIKGMSIEEVEAQLRLMKAAAAAKKDEAKRALGSEAKEHLKSALKKWLKSKGVSEDALSLADVFTTSKEAKAPETYKNPENGELYTYYGRGKRPAWTEGLKPIKTNGNGHAEAHKEAPASVN